MRKLCSVVLSLFAELYKELLVLQYVPTGFKNIEADMVTYLPSARIKMKCKGTRRISTSPGVRWILCKYFQTNHLGNEMGSIYAL